MSTNLKKDYLSNGQERIYRLDENGTEWLWYQDPKTKYIIRSATINEEDIQKLLRVSDQLDVEFFKKSVLQIDRGDNQQRDMWIIENNQGDPVCAADVFYLSKGDIEVTYYFKNPVFKKLYEKEVKRTLYNLGENEFRTSIYSRISINAIKPIYIQK